MKLKPLKLAPVLIAVCVILAVCLLRLADFSFFERLERMTYDMRVRKALLFPQPVATNLGFVAITDESLSALNHGLLERRYGLYWPRHVYGRMLRELSAQEAHTVAFDVLFAEMRPDHDQLRVANARWPDLTNFLATIHPGQTPTFYNDGREEFTLTDSDDYFAWQLKRAGNAILAAKDGLLPTPEFATNAWAVADISADLDPDGVLRRAKAFALYTNWHPLFKMAEADWEYGVDLKRAIAKPDKIVLLRTGLDPIEIPVDAENNFNLADFVGDKLPPGMAPKAKAFTVQRVWHMGIVMAARALNLDLSAADVDLEHGRITLKGVGGAERTLAVDREGYFPINWEITATDKRLTVQTIEQLLQQDKARWAGGAVDDRKVWRDKLALIGSVATGNDLTDRGATPIEENTFLVTKHFNVANSIITGRFVRRASLPVELLLIVVLGALTAVLTWRLRVFVATGSVLALALAYCAVSLWLYVQQRYWLPIVLPVVGLLLQHILLVTYRVVFEERERRRVKSIFSRVVAPDIANELLGMEKLSLGGARREVTVLFADVRGFTEFTDNAQQRVAEFVKQQGLSGDAAEACFDDSASETLNTVNQYLACVADTVKHHGGTLDKYIGDCVMAFWGAPTANPQHACACVRAAVDAQRGIHALNHKRHTEAHLREVENRARLSAGLVPKPPLATLALGTGIHTGPVTVGLMGSEAHILNYTVFGREVNLASRLEHESGRGRIIISDVTFRRLQRDDPPLAATCVALPAVKVKGFSSEVRIYEVPWRDSSESAHTQGKAGVNPP